MIYDCFQFFNELDILRLRLHVMNPVVDKFVISEATETFSGMKKPLYYEENKDLFKEFADKIIHIVVEDTPKGYTHDRDTFQKNAVGRGLTQCSDEDIIIFSDLDEIPNPEKVKEIAKAISENRHNEKDKIFHMAQRMFYCYLNMEEVSGELLAYCGEFEGIKNKKWLGTKICSYKIAKKMPLGELRWPKCKDNGIRIADGGWHFGYMGGNGEKSVRKRVEEKVKSAAHQEYNNRRTLAGVNDKIKDGEDIFGRNAKFERVPIDASFPEYLQMNISEYAHLIKPEETKTAKIFRHFRKHCRKYFQKGLISLKHFIKKILGKTE